MALSAHGQAVVLLTAHLTKVEKGAARPLSTAEWGRFALWLRDRGLQPEALLSAEPAKLLDGWLDKTVTRQRIEALLGRGTALGLALDRWERAGLWVMTRSDPDYPDRLKRRLRAGSPPLLFGCGNRSLLANGGLAVVGSREAEESELAFAARLGAEAAAQGLSIVSGGARGVDEAAMLGALQRECTTIGVLADSLLRAATSAKYRKYLMARDLALVSPFNPEARFEVGNAMTRNRYIYCLADAAIVVSSSLGKGGTWTGAIENLDEKWVPLWVKPSSRPASGNAELVRRGARWLPDGKADLSALMLPPESVAGTREPGHAQLDLLAARAPRSADSIREISSAAEREDSRRQRAAPASDSDLLRPGTLAQKLSLYEFFLLRMESLAAGGPLTLEELQTSLDLTKPQISAWLKRAVAEQQIMKLRAPVRYQWRGLSLRQPSIFDEDPIEPGRGLGRSTPD
jgi:predicted Rossmann fold nucleotide-binding protein DprA/Smf involved in DNA uptake